MRPSSKSSHLAALTTSPLAAAGGHGDLTLMPWAAHTPNATSGFFAAAQYASYTRCMRFEKPYHFLRAPTYFNRNLGQRKYESFNLGASCNASTCHFEQAHLLSGGAFVAALRHRTLAFVGESIARELFGFTACWLLPALLAEGLLDESEMEEVAARSERKSLPV